MRSDVVVTVMDSPLVVTPEPNSVVPFPLNPATVAVITTSCPDFRLPLSSDTVPAPVSTS